MTPQTRCLLLILNLLVPFLLFDGISAATAGGRKLTQTGAWTPVNPNDDYVKAVAAFAVAEYNRKAHRDLKFKRVVSGESQLVDGTNYKLVIEANNGLVTIVTAYEALVWTMDQSMDLKSFDPIPL